MAASRGCGLGRGGGAEAGRVVSSGTEITDGCGDRALPIAADSEALLSHLFAFWSAILVHLFLSR
jgi:hypothetical protein